MNYGQPEDFEYLKRLGVDVRGKIAIVRYGRSWRGLKAKLAQDNGAVGCLIYSDPREDGFFQSDAYPLGPMRPADGVQRGSVMDMERSIRAIHCLLDGHPEPGSENPSAKLPDPRRNSENDPQDSRAAHLLGRARCRCSSN